MVYTLTFNPSIDYIMYAKDYTCGSVNRSDVEEIAIGGKGINVSIVLHGLGVSSTALGYVAGKTGEMISDMASDAGINSDFIMLSDGFSRINVKLKSDVETDINGSGPVVNEDDINLLYDKLDSAKSGDFVVLAGSAARGVPDTVYADIMKRLKGKGINVIVDATGNLLTNCLEHKPFLIKPNNFELEEIVGKKLDSRDAVICAATALQTKGAQNVLVSLGGDGALLVCRDGNVYYKSAPRGKVVNTTGAGDSAVAGFIAGYISKSDYEYALSLSVCAGSATAFSTSLATGEEIAEVFNQNC